MKHKRIRKSGTGSITYVPERKSYKIRTRSYIDYRGKRVTDYLGSAPTYVEAENYLNKYSEFQKTYVKVIKYQADLNNAFKILHSKNKSDSTCSCFNDVRII